MSAAIYLASLMVLPSLQAFDGVGQRGVGVHDVAVFVFGVIDVGVRAINIALGVVGQVGDILDS